VYLKKNSIEYGEILDLFIASSHSQKSGLNWSSSLCWGVVLTEAGRKVNSLLYMFGNEIFAIFMTRASCMSNFVKDLAQDYRPLRLRNQANHSNLLPAEASYRGPWGRLLPSSAFGQIRQCLALTVAGPTKNYVVGKGGSKLYVWSTIV
jgi:hypothetical protein